jgi:hypothetical protein
MKSKGLGSGQRNAEKLFSQELEKLEKKAVLMSVWLKKLLKE